ncbi:MULTISPECIES: hypothetical protein [Sphingobacterium]|uniref:hypothetical protein n=1 Tax=Sphingobacterium TaxID=28453 RepID=UPI001048A044|nr:MULTISPECIES: hypothetical protein [Sphingobacterium]MBB2950837.1 hypothetical protein [Sphingobacterium sp. JUb56]MCS3552626.1 hypothetical protein [Sphingobacterium sp. JUb21]MCW2259263.1 hypothetical protein [Sphingobacterium kitahiroshimense]NJI72642.1 hypothetical protein [Sphingobacterium sp. B16(2022)]QQD12635.1 hypothetical protein JAZ75_18805 [Sphingobacterium sp. UDSM-2020]
MMDNNCDLILGSFYTKKLVDQLQLSMCIFLNKERRKAIGLFLAADKNEEGELLISYVQDNIGKPLSLIINKDVVLSNINHKKENFYYWQGTVGTIRSLLQLLDFYCINELGQKPVISIVSHPFVIEIMHMLEEIEKRNLQIEAKLKL